LEQIIARGKSERSIPYRVLHKDGTWRMHSSNASMISDGATGHSFIGIARDMTDQYRIERELEALRVAGQREEERIAIARDLHDDLSQELTGLHIELASLSRTAPEFETRRRLTAMKEELGNTIASVRGILAELRSDVLDELGLEGSVRWLLRNLRRKSGMICRLDYSPELFTMSPMVALAAYRIIQEALNNVVRHSCANSVRVRIMGNNDQLRITVSDNGVGMPEGQDADAGHYGIAGMRERARLCGGSLQFTKSKSGGTKVLAMLPAEK
jgi:signal transduction histidine kinase